MRPTENIILRIPRQFFGGAIEFNNDALFIDELKAVRKIVDDNLMNFSHIQVSVS